MGRQHEAHRGAHLPGRHLGEEDVFVHGPELQVVSVLVNKRLPSLVDLLKVMLTARKAARRLLRVLAAVREPLEVPRVN